MCTVICNVFSNGSVSNLANIGAFFPSWHFVSSKKKKEKGKKNKKRKENRTISYKFIIFVDKYAAIVGYIRITLVGMKCV